MSEFDDIFDEDLGEDFLPAGNDDATIIADTPLDDDIFEEKVVLTPEDSLLSEFLKSKGIQNNKIKIIDENDKEEEVDFFSLSKEDQLEILNAGQEEVSKGNDLQDEEQAFIDSLRANKKSVEQFLEEYKASILEEANIVAEPSYDIDAYTDEELFLLDLKGKYDLTDEELEKELEKELENKDLFTRKITKIREEYKKLEDNYKKEQEQEFTKQREIEYQGFVNTMVDVAVKTPELYGIELDDTEQDEVLSLLLNLDEKGASEFYKKLNDPKTLYEAAWFLRYGKEAFDAIKDAYEAEIAELKKKIKPKS